MTRPSLPQDPFDTTRPENDARGQERWILDHLFETADVGIVLMDADTRVIRGNRYAAVFMGIDYDTFAGTVYADYALSEDRASIMANTQKLFTGEIPYTVTERCFIQADGTPRWGQWKARLCRDPEGRVQGMLGILTDITLRKQTQVDLDRRKKLLDRTGSLAGVGGFFLYADRLEGLWTDETARIFDLEPGYTPFERVLNAFRGPTQKVIDDALKAVIDKKQPVDLELEITTEAGNQKWIRIIGSPFLENDRVVGIDGAIQDITARHLDRQALQASEAKHRVLMESAPFPLLAFRLSDGTLCYEIGRAHV